MCAVRQGKQMGAGWTGKAVLVTGAGGFIGSHLTERLTELGARVRAFLRYNSRNDRGLLEMVPCQVIQEIELVRGDLKDPWAVFRAVKGSEVVFHLGALIAIPYSYVNPLDYVQTNVLGTAHVLEAAMAHGVERVVMTSTSEVYGTARTVQIVEDHPTLGQSPYSASKIGADKLAESYRLSFDAPVATIRPFNTFGPRQSARAVIPTIILQALSGGPVRLGSLSPTRDFTYVTDTVEGFLRVGEAAEAVGEVINIGSGREISIGDLAQLIIRMVGGQIELRRDPERVRPAASEVERLVADTTRARKILGWEPRLTLEEGIERTIRWYRANFGRFKSQEYVI